jgi:eukaryotic-like serine/threonine-protein kinase
MKNVFRSLVISSCLLYAANTAMANDPLVWKHQTGGGIYATPLVHNNVLYCGSTDSSFYALNASSGTEVWHYKTDNPIRSTAAIDGNIVCFESGNQLYGLDLQGNLLWHDTLCSGSVTNQFDQWDYFHSSPIIVDGVAYIGTEKGFVYGINVQTGNTAFQCQTADTNNGIRTTPTVYNNKIYFGDWDGVFYAYDLSSGQKVWEYNTFPERLWTGGPPSISTFSVICNGNVFFAGRGCILYALNAETGVKQWSFLEPAGNMWLLGGPSISDSLIYLGTSNQQLLRAIHTVTGKCVWEKAVDGRVFCNPFVDSNFVYVGTGIEPADNIGSIFVFNKKTGKLENKYTLNAMLHSSPILVDSILYIGSANKYIYSFNKNAILANPYPKTAFRESGTINLNTLTHDTTFTLHIDNTGEAKDSMTISWTGRGINPRSLIAINPTSFTIEPHANQDLNITVSASQLGSMKYSISLQTKSEFNLENKTSVKMILFEVLSSTSVRLREEFPRNFSLNQNYPNPFNAMTIIRYSLPQSCPVILKIYNQIGQEIETCVNEYQTAGEHSIQWNADKLTSGIYFYRLQADRYSETRKTVLLK